MKKLSLGFLPSFRAILTSRCDVLTGTDTQRGAKSRIIALDKKSDRFNACSPPRVVYY
ncbi:hypothetical protein [Coleofasciculus sp. FACHB-SPT9]|uniref:hypothetical protein n=1 Tax=Coleofasciculus sp. FACHB-SPT9 TaxID=2692791 RepID=UPI001682C4B2|nr:hypothetical protein [Coleofasciculus sp. FACHB-SPT9]MBD1888874.1 hypothetical protein [Coleofasciculus sp. FACHB-SPT9]